VKPTGRPLRIHTLLTLACGLAPVVALGAEAAPAGVYLIGDVVDVIHLSDQPRTQADRLLIATRSEAVGADAVPPAASDRWHDRIESAVLKAASGNAIDPRLLRAVIATESSYGTRAVSPRGALGLMQLMPETARRYGVTDPFDVSQNVEAGALHLRHLLDRFDQDVVLALAAYNAGAEAVTRHGRRVPPFAETQTYVTRVLGRLSNTVTPRPSSRTPIAP